MKRNSKRFLSLFITVPMTLSLMATPVFATVPDNAAAPVVSEQENAAVPEATEEQGSEATPETAEETQQDPAVSAPETTEETQEKHRSSSGNCRAGGTGTGHNDHDQRQPFHFHDRCVQNRGAGDQRQRDAADGRGTEFC